MSINHTFPRGPAAENARTDCHMHVYDARYPAAPGATLLPPDALLPDYLAVRSQLGLSRSVVVQPSAYGTDNRCTLDACDALNAADAGSARAVVSVDTDVSSGALRDLRRRGARGLRFGLAPGSANTPESIVPLARLAADHGMHVQLTLSARRFVAMEALLAGLPCALVIDHMGNIAPSEGTGHAAFATLRRLLDAGSTWLKLSGAYLLSEAGADQDAEPWQAAGALMRAFVVAAPQRMVWGSNWPHPTHVAHPPDDRALFSLLERVCGSAETLDRILALNPQSLYGFESHE